MSAHGFKSLFMAASVAGAALGCYLVSLNVASERAKLERVEGKIVLAQRDIRLLQTEIGTRGRLAQLERWNVGFIRLAAPSADQFLEGGFQLATMVTPDATLAVDMPIVLASAPTDQGIARRSSTSDLDDAPPATTDRPRAPSAKDMMHIASFQRPAVIRPAKPLADKPALAKTASANNVAARRTKVGSVDALAPLPVAKEAAKSNPSSMAASPSPKTKESGTPQ